MRRFVALLLLPLLALVGGPGRAQTYAADPSMSARLAQLEAQVQTLSRQVYRSGGSVPAAPLPGPPVGIGAGGGGADLEARLQTLEEQMRQLTGAVERANNAASQAQAQVAKLQGDIDLRFQDLQRGGGAPVAEAPPPRPGKPPRAPAPDTASADAPTVGTLGTISDVPGGGAGTPEQQYAAAFDLLNRGDNEAAAAAFRDFVKRYPTSSLAGNAQYWLGETHYNRGDYQAAASTYGEVYAKYPKSAKAPDALLKLGMSLGQLGRKDDACTSFAELDRRFPTAAANVKRTEATERARLKCPAAG